MITVDFVDDTPNELVEKFSEYFRIDAAALKSYFLTVNPDTLIPEVIVKKFDLSLNKYNSSDLAIMCRHITTANEEGLNFFRSNGILNLREMLQKKTPLSDFLLKHEIKINVDEAIIEVKNKEYPILQSKEICPYCYTGKETVCSAYSRCDLFDKITILATKLYYYGATVECFINSPLSKMKRYSTICRFPEILDTLDKILSKARGLYDTTYTLCMDWIAEKKDCYLLVYPSLLSDMETFAPISFQAAYEDIKGCLTYCGYTYSDYYEKKVPQNIFDNYHFIRKFVSIYFYNSEEYGSLLPDMSVAPKIVKYYRVVGDNLIGVQ